VNLGDHLGHEHRDGSDPFIGYRAWMVRIKHGDATLVSLVMNAAWLKGLPTLAECNCPLLTHSCGLYAWNATFQALAIMGTTTFQQWRAINAGPIAVGEARLWGDVDVHEYGFRATIGQPSALYVPRLERDNVAIELAAHQYGIPLVDPWKARSSVDIVKGTHVAF